MRSLPDLDLDEADLGGTLDPRSFKRVELSSPCFNDHWSFKNGGGKSSLFRFIGGFESPKSYGHFANMIW